MKKIATLIIPLLLAGTISVWAQSGGVSKGQKGAGPVDYSRKAKTSQTEGKGVPYSKDKEQQRSEAKGGVPAASSPSAGNGLSTSGQSSTKSGKKTKSSPSGSQNN
jgi:hypothetical protein